MNPLCFTARIEFDNLFRYAFLHFLASLSHVFDSISLQNLSCLVTSLEFYKSILKTQIITELVIVYFKLWLLE